MPTLVERFEAFIKTVDGFESIDALLRDGHIIQKNKDDYLADYLFDGRKIIIEQKYLVSDPNKRAQKFLDKVVKERGIEVHGYVSADRIFEGQPDCELLGIQFVKSISRRVKEIVKKADKQTRATKRLLKLPDSLGVLVILSDASATFPLELIVHRARETFQMGGSGVNARYPHNTALIVISEADVWLNKPYESGRIGFGLSKDSPLKEFCVSLGRKWAQFNGVPFVPRPASWSWINLDG